MPLKLVTDFRDYYDHAFADEGEPFYRKAASGPNRIEMFNILSSIGIDVPKHGIVTDLYKDLEGQHADQKQFQDYSKIVQLVVYDDLYTHQGNGKQLMTLDEANQKAPNNYAAQFLPSFSAGSWHKGADKYPETMRCLVVGKEVYWLLYSSDDKWRSNCGNVEISEIKQLSRKVYPRMENIQLPLYAIDFASPYGRHAVNDLTAIDFNIAPGLTGTPVQDDFAPWEVVQLIERRQEEINQSK